MFGWTELLIVLGIVVLLFGSSRIPALARALGESIQEFRSGIGKSPGSLSEDSAEKSS